MKTVEVNRSIVIVRPKQPCIDWVNRLSDEEPTVSLEEVRRDASIYLIPEFENEHQVKQILKTYFSMIFEHELWSWMTDEATWPENRDFKTFKQWFHCEFHDLVLDLCREDLGRAI